MNSKETFPQPYFVAHQCLKRSIIYFFVLLIVVGYICYDDEAAQGIINPKKPANETSKMVSCGMNLKKKKIFFFRNVVGNFWYDNKTPQRIIKPKKTAKKNSKMGSFGKNLKKKKIFFFF